MSSLPRVGTNSERVHSHASNPKGHLGAERTSERRNTGGRGGAKLPSLHGNRTTSILGSAAMATGAHQRRALRSSQVPSVPPIRGSIVSCRPQGRSQSGNYSDFPLPVKDSQSCGKKYGETSLKAHERRCPERVMSNTKKGVCKGAGQGDDATPPAAKPLQRGLSYLSDAGSSVSGSERSVVDQKGQQMWKPLSCRCRFCGETFGSHSIDIHEKRCSETVHQSTTPETERLRRANHKRTSNTKQHHSRPQRGNWSRLKEDSSNALSPPPPPPPLPRPQTRTLHYSTLTGLELPCISNRTAEELSDHHSPDSGHFSEPQKRTVMCKKCGEDIDSDKIAVHSRLCRSMATQVSQGAITFSTPPGGKRRVQQVRLRTGNPTSSLPGVACYICGQLFGSISISIHEPQCLKRWEVENKKLPIRERRPLPKRPVTRPQRAEVVSAHDATVVGSLPAEAHTAAAGSAHTQIPDEVVEKYFLNCYAEFEQELIPCDKCGRTFAPERWVKHNGRCNAKPLTSTARTGKK